MKKEIICVYQDCYLCGDKGKKDLELIRDRELNVRKVSFASPEGMKLCKRAVFEAGIGKMPFFYDGNKFGQKLTDLLKKTKRKAVKNGSDK